MLNRAMSIVPAQRARRGEASWTDAGRTFVVTLARLRLGVDIASPESPSVHEYEDRFDIIFNVQTVLNFTDRVVLWIRNVSTGRVQTDTSI